MIGKNHSRVRCEYGKGHNIDLVNCHCPIPNYKSDFLACIFNEYDNDFKITSLSTGRKNITFKQRFQIGILMNWISLKRNFRLKEDLSIIK